MRSSFVNALGRNKFYDLALSPNPVNLHPFHHSYVAGDQQHIADFVFNAGLCQEKTKMLTPMVPINTETRYPEIGKSLYKNNQNISDYLSKINSIGLGDR